MAIVGSSSIGRQGRVRLPVFGGGAAVAPAPLAPIVGTAPSIFYSQGKAVAGYSGPASRLKNVADTGTTYDVPIGADNNLDLSGYAAWAGSATTVTAVTTWYDQSGNGYDAVQATNNNRPKFVRQLTYNGYATLNFRDINKYLTIPSGHTVDRQLVTVFAVFAMPTSNTSGGYGFAQLGDNTTGLNMSRTGNGIASGTLAVHTARPVTFVLSNGAGTTQLKYRLNKLVSNLTTLTSATLTGGRIGYGSASATIGDAAFLCFAVYPGVLSDADKILLEDWAAARWGVNFSTTLPLVFYEGDSITAGTGPDDGRDLNAEIAFNLNQTVHSVNYAVAGDSLAQMYADRVATFASAYTAGRSRYIFHLFGGTNDIAGRSAYQFVKAVVSTTGSATTGTSVVTVADPTGILPGQTFYAPNGVPGGGLIVSSVVGNDVNLSGGTIASTITAGTPVRFGVRATTTANVPAGSTVIPVSSTAGMSAGDTVEMSGVDYGAVIVPGGVGANSITISAPTTGSTVATGAAVRIIDLSLADDRATELWTTYLLPYIQYAKTYSPQNFQVVVGTIIPRGWTDTVYKERARVTFNDLIRNNAVTYGYRVADYGAISALSQGAPRNAPNSTLLPDVVHPNGDGMEYLGPVGAAAIQPYLP